jgi:hypothetical protein
MDKVTIALHIEIKVGGSDNLISNRLWTPVSQVI